MTHVSTDTQADDSTLATATRRLHRALLDVLLTTGDIPSDAVLDRAAGIAADALPDHLRELAAADYAGFDESGRLTCLYPLSAGPTPHVVGIDGRRRFAMCAIDALGIAAMLGHAISIESRCGDCGTVIRLELRPGAIAAVTPAGAAVVARPGSDGSAREVRCPFTVFACGPGHALALVARTPGTHVFTLEEAHAYGEAIFGDLHRAGILPASRRWFAGLVRANGQGGR